MRFCEVSDLRRGVAGKRGRAFYWKVSRNWDLSLACFVASFLLV
jgi:hypothetical protein